MMVELLPRDCFACRSQLLYLSCHGCDIMKDGLCEGLENCLVLDLAHTAVSDDGLQTLLDRVRQAALHACCASIVLS